jgi:hypothetical protein
MTLAANLAIHPDARSGESTMARVYEFLGRFVSYPSEYAHVAHAAWIVHAHLMDRWDSTPRLAFLSPEPGSGKSRALEVTETLVPRPVNTVNVSPAYLFRKIAGEEGPPTVLFDEIDTVFGPKARENEELRGWLNAGHRRGATAGRCVVRGKVIETEELPAYAAVALAGLGWLPDTILTRSVVIRMRRRHNGEKVEPFRLRLVRNEADVIRRMIESWAARQPRQINWQHLYLPETIQDRDADVWEPLIAVADLVGGEWPSRVRDAAVALVTASKETEPTLGIRLLADLRVIFDTDNQLQTNTIVAALVGDEEGPWQDLRGRPLDSRSLANLLKQYEVKPRQLWFGPRQARGYARADFEDVWRRYLPPLSAEHVVSVTNVTGQCDSDSVTDVTDVTRFSQSSVEGVTCDHCGATGGILECAFGSAAVRLHRDCITLWSEYQNALEVDGGR